jgi:glyoxylase I family protein
METSGLDHINLSVTDLDRSRRFYRDVLGLAVQEAPDFLGGAFYFNVGEVELWFVRHDRTPDTDRFSEFRVGLDHLSFRAPDEAALHDLVNRLRAAAVETTGVKTDPASSKRYVVFRDPDNIQLEYWLDEPINRSEEY